MRHMSDEKLTELMNNAFKGEYKFTLIDGKITGDEIERTEKPGMFPNWGRAFLWLVVLPLLLILLGILCGKIFPDIIDWAWKGFPVKF